MMHVISSSLMRAIEQAAIYSGRATESALMERAGQAVADEALRRWGGGRNPSRHAVVLCGPGNNGGDGFVVARLLSENGWRVDVFEIEATRDQDCAANIARRSWLDAGRVQEFAGFDRDCMEEGSVFIDALFGTGLTRPVSSEVCRVLDTAFGAGRSIAVDIMSGVNADTGRILSESPFDPTPASATVTFQAAKQGHFLGRGGCLTGDIRVASIGLEPELEEFAGSLLAARLFNPAERQAAELLSKSQGKHKYDYGHVLVLSGRPGMGGAARLAARGALRTGAGLVTVGVPEGALPEHAAQLEAIMLQETGSTRAIREYSTERRVNAYCIGPGIGVGLNTRRMVKCIVESGKPAVLDADALTSFEKWQQEFFELLHRQCVLTPHAGEFRRLFPDIAGQLGDSASYSKMDATRDAAARAGATVLFKGHDTVVADPDGRVELVSSAGVPSTPWLATAGAGDVLAGIVAALLGRGVAPRLAAAFGAWLHAAAARRFGPGLIAEDLPETLPSVFREIGV